MKALIEPIAAVLRVVPGDGNHGQPYSFATTVRWVDRQTVELIGAMRSPTLAEAQAIIQALKALGAQRIILRRWRAGKEQTHVWQTRS